MYNLTVEQALELALQHYQRGDAQNSLAVCEAVLSAAPNHPDALHVSAMALAARGELPAALDRLERACDACPDDWQLRHNLGCLHLRAGNFERAALVLEHARQLDQSKPQTLISLGDALRRVGQHDRAVLAYESALKLDGRNAIALVGRGQAQLASGQTQPAIESFQRAREIQPESIAVLINLGVAQTEAGQCTQAEQSLQQALQLDPKNAVIANNLAVARMRAGNPSGAMEMLQAAIKLDPEYPEPYRNAANLLAEWERYDEALPYYDRAQQLDSEFVEAFLDKGVATAAMGLTEEARTNFQRALELQPDSFVARWGLCMSQLSSWYADAEQIEIERARYQRALNNLIEVADSLSGAALVEAAEAAGTLQPFFLSYQGKSNKDLQALYGELAAKIMAKRFPEFVAPIAPPPVNPRERIRIGFVSRQFGENPVWNMVISGFVRNLNRERFEVTGYLTGGMAAPEAQALFDKVVSGLGFEALCRKIKDDRLHVLILTDALIDPVSVKIGSLRLAATQCLAWGHPETSGFKQIDYYLGCDEVEPENAQECYSEKLVRLPGLMADMRRTTFEPDAGRLPQFNIRSDATIYLCAQTLFKYLPQHDDVFPRIAEQVPAAQFIFFKRPEWVCEKYAQRLRRAFEARNLEFDRHVLFLPKLTRGEFLQLCKQSHAFLDTFEFTGGATTVDAIEMTLPVVTTPGIVMRGRQSAAYLRNIGVEETIAPTKDEFVSIAVRLGLDPGFRQRISQMIEQGKDRLYGDLRPVRGLEDFLEGIVHSQ